MNFILLPFSRFFVNFLKLKQHRHKSSAHYNNSRALRLHFADSHPHTGGCNKNLFNLNLTFPLVYKIYTRIRESRRERESEGAIMQASWLIKRSNDKCEQKFVNLSALVNIAKTREGIDNCWLMAPICSHCSLFCCVNIRKSPLQWWMEKYSKNSPTSALIPAFP